MSVFDKLRRGKKDSFSSSLGGDDSGLDLPDLDGPKSDPFGSMNPQGSGSDPFGSSGGPNNSFGSNNSPSSDPFGSNSSSNDPFGGASRPNDPLSSPQPRPNRPSFDTSNPDLNAQLGTPKPRDYAEREDSTLRMPSSPPAAAAPAQDNNFSELFGKDMQLVLARLDAIKSELDSLHQRVKKIERIADADRDAAQKANYGRW